MPVAVMFGVDIAEPLFDDDLDESGAHVELTSTEGEPVSVDWVVNVPEGKGSK